MNRNLRQHVLLASGNSRIVGLSAVLLLLPLLAALFFATSRPVAASCGGVTPVTTEAELNTAIATFNAAPAPCVFLIVLMNDITLTNFLTPITNTDAANFLSIGGDAVTLDGDGHATIDASTAASGLQVIGLTITGSNQAAIASSANLIVTNSRLVENYMGLHVQNGTADVTGTTISLNENDGINNQATLSLTDSTVSYNAGFGIFNPSGNLTILNSTISANYTGLYATGFSDLSIYDSTIANHTNNGVILEDFTDMTLFNSLLANSSGNDCVAFGPATVNIQYSLFETTSACGATDGIDGNIVGANPVIGPLQDNGGLNHTHTHALLSLSGTASQVSPALDVGNSALLPVPSPAFDQRGGPFIRIANSILDIGAYEGAYSIVCPAFPINVATAVQLNDAIICYNAQTTPGSYTINITADIDLTSATMAIDNPIANISLTIDGQDFTIDAQGSPGARPFEVAQNSDVFILDLTISGGNAGGYGGGILNDGALDLNNVTLSNNKSNAAGGAVGNRGQLVVTASTFDSNGVVGVGLGGGIYSEGESASAFVTESTFSNNGAEAGGGIFANSETALAVRSSTFVGNTADYAGGGIGLEFTDVPTIVTNSTFSGNSAGDYGGGVANSFSALTINNSTFVDNSATQGGALTTGFLFCFTADTQVLMADGTTKRIADLEVGDELLSYDFETGQQVTSTVRATMSKEVDEFLRLNNLEVTAEHPFAVGNDEWVKAKDLRIGDRVMSDDGWTTITSKEVVEKTAEVYNINVDGPHNYYVSDGVNQYLVHNKLADVALADTEVNNTIITDSTGGDCYSAGGNFQGSNNLLDDFAVGPCAGLGTAAVTNLNLTLANNGGPTMTHALLAGSNAIGGGNNALALDTDGDPLSFDQRGTGFPRIVNTTVDVGAYEFTPPVVSGFCPVDPAVGNLRTSVLGVGQGNATKGFRTRKLVVPHPDDVDSLYGQLAANSIGVMKYVRFLPQGNPTIQIKPPTSLAFNAYAISWWGTDLPTDAAWVKGQFFWGAGGNKSPRAFVLWPTHTTAEPYANVFTTFDTSSENHVSWHVGFYPQQTQTIAIPATQAAGATVNVSLALVDVDGDGRPVVVTVAAGDVSEQRVITAPNRGDRLNIEVFALANVDAGVDEVTITLESPDDIAFPPNGGDSAAVIGAAVSYACEDN